MKQYYVEGTYRKKKAQSKASRSRTAEKADIEPFARTIWASNPAEAEQLATDALDGGHWVDGPYVGATSEEKRMRAIGAPELPGFGTSSKKGSKNKRK